CAHKSAFAYGDAWQDGGVGANGDAVFDHGWHYVPVRVRLRKSVAACGAWVNVVGEHDAVADEDTVTNGHAFADEGVAGNLAVAADSGILLDFDEGANACAGADAATVKVDKIGVGNDHAFVQLDIRCDHAAPQSLSWIARRPPHVSRPFRGNVAGLSAVSSAAHTATRWLFGAGVN